MAVSLSVTYTDVPSVSVTTGTVPRVIARRIEAEWSEALDHPQPVGRSHEIFAEARIDDDVLQQLSRIRCLGGELAERGHVRAPELRQLMAQVERQERALRSVVQHDGHTMAGGTASLLATLATLADTFPQWPVHLVGSGPVVLAEHVVAEIAAAVGELLGNVVKHAHADQVWVSVLETDGDVTVDVRDDGVGFDYDESALAATGRLGLLVSVQARMARLGGTALVRGRPGRGAEIELCLRRST